MPSEKFSLISKHGNVSVECRFGGCYRLRWFFDGTRYCLSIGKGEIAQSVAQARAQEINSDILLDRFDATLAKYSPKHAREIERKQKLGELTLSDIWEQYKQANAERVAKTTQKNSWVMTNRAIAKLSPDALELAKSHLLVPELLQHHSPSHIARCIDDINAACNWAENKGLIAKNPYSKLAKQLPKRQQRGSSRECFEPDEIKRILKAFEKGGRGIYAYYVKFLALTGFRPEEAIALTWDDIRHKEGGTAEIIVNKAHSKGVLKETKTYDTRVFPCNIQLTEFIAQIPRTENANNLLFPNARGGYIDQHNFLSRHWKPIVSELNIKRKISQYLPPYNLRHSFITRLIREGYDPATVAKLAGNSPEVIMKHYLAARKDVTLPEL